MESNDTAVVNNDSNLLIQSSSDTGPVEKLRGPSFAAEEDRDICSAWIKISEDPIKGKYRGNKYWSMVAAEFNLTEHPDQGPREASSLRSRWNIFAPRVIEYHDYFLTIERTNANLTGLFAKFGAADILYENDHQQKRFTFQHCYLILKKSSMWRNMAESKNQKNANKSSKKRIAIDTIIDLNTDQQVVAGDNCGSSFAEQPQAVEEQVPEEAVAAAPAAAAAGINNHESDRIPAFRLKNSHKKRKRSSKEDRYLEKAFEKAFDMTLEEKHEIKDAINAKALREAIEVRREFNRMYQEKSDRELFLMDIHHPDSVKYFERARKLALLRQSAAILAETEKASMVEEAAVTVEDSETEAGSNNS